jgi:hypothetical protein
MFEDLQCFIARMKFRLAERKRPKIYVSAEGLVVVTATGSEIVPWVAIKRIAAFRWDIYLGVVVALAFEIEDGSTLHIIEGDPAWLHSLDAVDRKFSTARAKADWFLDVAAGRQNVVLIYDRNGEPIARHEATYTNPNH